MKAHRVARVAEVIREVAAETILFQLQDPRIKGVTVTRAEVSGDLQIAKVFVSIMGTEREQALCMHGLKNSAGYVQSKLGSRLKTRFTPTIKFILDEGVKKSIEMTRLINEGLAQSKPAAVEGEEGAPQNAQKGASEIANDDAKEGARETHDVNLHDDVDDDDDEDVDDEDEVADDDSTPDETEEDEN